jgi:uncharacterized membrane protein YdjX (TVP38/TMEM64 family)
MEHVMKSKNKFIGFSVLALVLVTMTCVYLFTPIGDYLSIDKITEITEEIPDNLTSAGIFLLVFLIGGMLLAPIPLMAFAVSLVFDIWLSVLIVIPGFMLASLSGYSIGRMIDTSIFGESVEKHIDGIKDKVDDKGAWAVVALRLAPTPPFTITSMIAGTLKINVFKFLVASTFGIMPLGLSAVFFGKGAIEMMQDPSGIAATSIVAAIILFSIYIVMKRKQSQQ